MSVIIVGPEKNVAELRSRVLNDSVSDAEAEALSAAIAAANPGVDLSSLTPGTVLTLPDHLRQVRVQNELSLDPTSQQAVTEVLSVSTGALAQLALIAKARDSAAAAERETLAQALASEQLVAAARAAPAIAASVEAARRSLDEAPAQAEAERAAFAQAEAEWTAELETIASLFTGGQVTSGPQS